MRFVLKKWLPIIWFILLLVSAYSLVGNIQIVSCVFNGSGIMIIGGSNNNLINNTVSQICNFSISNSQSIVLNIYLSLSLTVIFSFLFGNSLGKRKK